MILFMCIIYTAYDVSNKHGTYILHLFTLSLLFEWLHHSHPILPINHCTLHSESIPIPPFPPTPLSMQVSPSLTPNSQSTSLLTLTPSQLTLTLSPHHSLTPNSHSPSLFTLTPPTHTHPLSSPSLPPNSHSPSLLTLTPSQLTLTLSPHPHSLPTHTHPLSLPTFNLLPLTLSTPQLLFSSTSYSFLLLPIPHPSTLTHTSHTPHPPPLTLHPSHPSHLSLPLTLTQPIPHPLSPPTQRRCDSITYKRIRFLTNMLVRIVRVHFTVHFLRITSSFS